MMVFEHNVTGEREQVKTAAELRECLERLDGGVDVSLELDGDHFVQAIGNTREGLYYLGYKDGAGRLAYLSTEPGTQEQMVDFFLRYFSGGPDWRDGFDWEGIASGPAWLAYLYTGLLAGLLSMGLWAEGGGHLIGWVWALTLGVMVSTWLLSRTQPVRHRIVDMVVKLKTTRQK